MAGARARRINNSEKLQYLVSINIRSVTVVGFFALKIMALCKNVFHFCLISTLSSSYLDRAIRGMGYFLWLVEPRSIHQARGVL
jgi:hypothetical protein